MCNKEQILKELLVLNSIWFRISFEIIQHKNVYNIPIDKYIQDIIQVQIDSNLEKCDLVYEKGEGFDSEGDEEFHEKEVTKQSEMLD